MSTIPSEAYPPSLSVVLSFWNEADVIPELVQRLRTTLTGERSKNHIRDYELIFVNDVSTDNSLELLVELAKEENDIKILNMSRNFGVSPCVMAGLRFSSGDLVVYMDADLQDPPEVIPQMIEAWREGENVDVVHTKRLSRDGESPVKLWITKVGYDILHRTSSIKLQTEVGDFKLLSRRVVTYLLQLKEKNPFMRGLVLWVGFNQVTITYNREARFAGETKFRVFSLAVISNFFSSALVSFSNIPLQIASILGGLSSVLSLILIIHVLLEKLQGRNLPGWTAIMVAVLFIGGVQLLSIGILGLYVSNIFLESKGRPLYIVSDTFGFEDNQIDPLTNEPIPNKTQIQNVKSVTDDYVTK